MGCYWVLYYFIDLSKWLQLRLRSYSKVLLKSLRKNNSAEIKVINFLVTISGTINHFYGEKLSLSHYLRALIFADKEFFALSWPIITLLRITNPYFLHNFDNWLLLDLLF